MNIHKCHNNFMDNTSLVNDRDFPLRHQLGNLVDYEDVINKDILELLGYDESLPEEKRDELYTKIVDTIQNRLLLSILDRLSDEDMKEFLELGDDGEGFRRFFEEKNIDVTQLLMKEALIFKTELVELKNYKFPASSQDG